MKGRIHIPIGFLACFVVYLLTYYWFDNGDTFALVFFGVFGSILPDLDQMINRHRDAFFHSALFPALGVIYMIFWNEGRYYDVFFLLLGVGFHLLFDLKIHDKNKEGEPQKVGTYCIVKPGFVLKDKNEKKPKNKTTEINSDKNKKPDSKKKKVASIDRMTGKHTDQWLILNTVACFAMCFILYIAY